MFYAILSLFAFMVAIVWFRSRKKRDFALFALSLSMVVGLWLIDFFVESPREEAMRKMKEIVVATHDKNLARFSTHISDSFKYQDLNKKQLEEKVKAVFQMSTFSGIDMSGFSREEYQKIDDSTIKIAFDSWPTGYGLPNYRFHCWATFVKDNDKQFRLNTFELFNNNAGKNDPPVVLEQLR